MLKKDAAANAIALMFLLSLLTVRAGADQAVESVGNVTLWYSQPAAVFQEALPVGNGRLGAMVLGKTAQERIVLNEETIWTGAPVEPRSVHGPGALPTIRRLIFEEKYGEAKKMFDEQMRPVPMWYARYQVLGNLYLTFPGHDTYTDYRRELNIDSPVVKVSYTADGVKYTREVVASPDDQVIAIELTADRPGKISFTTGIEGVVNDDKDWPDDGYYMARTYHPNRLILRGKNANSYGVRGRLEYQGTIKVLNQGGKLTRDSKTLKVENADTATLLIAAATNFVNYKDVSANPDQRIRECFRKLGDKSFERIKKDAIASHQKFFRRVSLDFGDTQASRLPTDQRLKKYNDGRDPQLAALFFQFGRYLLITSSRPGTQPANLQGIWNESSVPSWDGKYTTNINCEMNYWPAEVCNLTECAEPLFTMIMELSQTGRKTARDFFGVEGWLLGFNTDIWRNTSPIGGGTFGSWSTGGAWLCTHLWEHYLFTEDKEFLQKAYPVMKGSAEFFLNTLVEHPKHKWLVTCPSNSPENDFRRGDRSDRICAGPTMDMQILRYLFDSCAKASEVLGKDRNFRKQVLEAKSRLAPNQVGQYGQLQEWLDDLDNPKDRHRHFSHLWGMYPGIEISVERTPGLAKAVEKSLEFRGRGGTGFGMTWQMCLWARNYKPEIAHIMFQNLIRRNTYPNLFSKCYDALQVDGTFGCTAGIAEMLLQSHLGVIHLLPALPGAWPNGSVQGLCARGGFEVDIVWKDGKLTGATIRSKLGNSCKVRYGDIIVDYKTKVGESIKLNGKLQRN